MCTAVLNCPYKILIDFTGYYSLVMFPLSMPFRLSYLLAFGHRLRDMLNAGDDWPHLTSIDLKEIMYGTWFNSKGTLTLDP